MTTLSSRTVTYKPSPTGTKFHANDDFIKGIMGPVGSGKTVACVQDLFKRSIEQEPHSDGVRYTHWAFIRKTYSELKNTTLETFRQWIPPEVHTVKMTAPYSGHGRFTWVDGSTVDIKTTWLALDNEATAMDKLRSFEITGAMLNEASQLPEVIMEELVGRVGRYRGTPGAPFATWRGIIMDTNPPPEEHWFFDMFENERVIRGKDGEEYRATLFRQPGGLIEDPYEEGVYHPNPEAENIEYLDGGYDYYFRQLATASKERVNTLILGNYGAVHTGKPVHPGFRRAVHVAKREIEPRTSEKIVIGIDWGINNPAAVFTQLDPGTGTVNVLDELSPEDVTLEEFVMDHIGELLRDKYRGFEVEAASDPAGLQRQQIGGYTAIDTARSLGLKVYPAVTNEFAARKDAVDYFIGREEGLRINPHCTRMIGALLGGYRFKMTRYNTAFPSADKNEYSHIADALQYACLAHRKGVSNARNWFSRARGPRKPHKFV